MGAEGFPKVFSATNGKSKEASADKVMEKKVLKEKEARRTKARRRS